MVQHVSYSSLEAVFGSEWVKLKFLKGLLQQFCVVSSHESMRVNDFTMMLVCLCQLKDTYFYRSYQSK